MPMYRTAVLESPAAKLNELASHIEGPECILISANFSGGRYILNIEPALPDEQVPHLGLEPI